jgi:hypothetical protein
MDERRGRGPAVSERQGMAGLDDAGHHVEEVPDCRLALRYVPENAGIISSAGRRATQSGAAQGGAAGQMPRDAAWKATTSSSRAASARLLQPDYSAGSHPSP